jgi:predicted transcriptional regulator
MVMNVPCENIIWRVLPAIRKEFSINLMKNYGLNQKQVAELIGITPAAVCQYLSDKRGVDIPDIDILLEIEKSTNIIFENGPESLVNETCRICSILKSRGMIERI